MAQVSQGQSLFEAHCQSCHGIYSAGTGPALNNILQKRPIPWLFEFIKSSQTLITQGDTAAISIYHQYLEVKMPDQILLDGQILDILNYIQHHSTLTPDRPINQQLELENSINENFMSEPSLFQEITKYILIITCLILVSWMILRWWRRN